MHRSNYLRSCSRVPPSWAGGAVASGKRPSESGKPVSLPVAQASGFSRLASSRAGLSRGAILADVFMVVLWGATIPGLMWLGAVGGF
ncbi:MAG: hypothetical protein AB7E59_03665 [Pusillimonas sp.]